MSLTDPNCVSIPTSRYLRVSRDGDEITLDISHTAPVTLRLVFSGAVAVSALRYGEIVDDLDTLRRPPGGMGGVYVQQLQELLHGDQK